MASGVRLFKNWERLHINEGDRNRVVTVAAGGECYRTRKNPFLQGWYCLR